MSTRSIVTLMTAIASSSPAAAQMPTDPYVARYLHDRQGAFSLTFDDGFNNEVDDTLAILDPLGIKGTFFLVPQYMNDPARTARMVTWDTTRAMMANGHEIGTHGSITTKLHEAPDDVLDRLINGSWKAIADETGREPISYAVPGGTDGEDPRVQAKVYEHHYFLRGPVIGYGSTDFRHWTDEGTREQINAGIENGEWLVGMVHSIVDGYSPFKSRDEFRIHCEWLKAQDERLWVAPMGDVGRYVREQEASHLKVTTVSDSSVTVQLTSAAGPKQVFNVPLTVVIPVNGAKSATARYKDGGAELPVIIRSDKLLLDIVPDGRAVELSWAMAR